MAKKTKKPAPKKKTAAKKKSAAKVKAAPKKNVAPKKKVAVKTKVTAKKKATPQKKSAAKAPPKAAPKTAPKTKATAKAHAFVSPLGDRVLVFRMEVSERTPGGLFIPQSAQSLPNQGEVLAVGPGQVDKRGAIRPLGVQVGDVVAFTTYGGRAIEFAGKEYLLLRADEILGIVES